MGGQEKTGPDGMTSTERNLYLSAQQAVRALNKRLEDRGSAQEFEVLSSEDKANKK